MPLCLKKTCGSRLRPFYLASCCFLFSSSHHEKLQKGSRISLQSSSFGRVLVVGEERENCKFIALNFFLFHRKLIFLEKVFNKQDTSKSRSKKGNFRRERRKFRRNNSASLRLLWNLLRVKKFHEASFSAEPGRQLMISVFQEMKQQQKISRANWEWNVEIDFFLNVSDSGRRSCSTHFQVFVLFSSHSAKRAFCWVGGKLTGVDVTDRKKASRFNQRLN